MPYTREAEARQLVDDIVALLVSEFGFTVEGASSKQTNGAGGQSADWETLVQSIITGADYHDSITRLAASAVARGFSVDQTITLLQDLMNASTATRDERWQARYSEIRRAAKSAFKKFAPPPAGIDQAEGVSLDDFHAYMPQHTYIFVPTREMWAAGSVNARVPDSAR